MEGEEITIDRKALNALAVSSRINILKALRERRKTLSELARETGLSPSTVSEHLGLLLDAGLVAREDTGRKWVYYSLTEKGETVVGGRVKRRMITFALLALFALSFLYVLTVYLQQPGAQMTRVPGQQVPEAGEKLVVPEKASTIAEGASPAPVKYPPESFSPPPGPGNYTNTTSGS